MKRIILAGFAVALFVVGFGYIKREPLFLSYLASKTPDVTLAEHKAFIAPHIQVRAPENTAAPYPTVILFHGCAGMRQGFMDQWATVVNNVGYMAVIVDSHTPRDIDRREALARVCQGEILIGQERAGDILAAYQIVRERQDVDKGNIILAGWSHGAWSIMDFLTMNLKGERPAQISDRQKDIEPPAGAILFYPYCGEGSRSRFDSWQGDGATLAFIAGKDTIVNAQECVDVFSKLERRGETIDLHYYPNAEHVFDDATLTENRDRWYNEEYANDAMARVSDYLKTQNR